MPASMLRIIHRLAIVLLIGICPFSIINLLNGNIIVGSLILIISASIFYVTLHISRHQTYKSKIVFWIIMPLTYYLLYLLVVGSGIVGILWCFPTLVIVNFIMKQRRAMISNILILIVLSPEMWSQFDLSLVLRMYASLVTVAALASLFVNVIMDQQNKLHKLAITDPLTGLLNRLTLEDNITLAIQQHSRTSNPMSLASIDIDHFKLINDKHGHDVGDKVLIKIANLLQQRSRHVDKVYRLGGEEFLVVLFNTNLQNARHFANAIQQALAELDIEEALNPTLSIGLAEVDQEKSWEEWLKHADEKLYQAKDNGRNLIIS